MAYTHIAHDCQVGSDVIMANAASLAGHVVVEDCAILGAFTIVHQFCRIGAYAFSAMGAVILKDVPPFVTVAGNSASPHGLNTEGLRRREFPVHTVQSAQIRVQDRLQAWPHARGRRSSSLPVPRKRRPRWTASAHS